MKILVKLLIKD